MATSVTPDTLVFYTGSTTPVLRLILRFDLPGFPRASLVGATVTFRLKRIGSRSTLWRRFEERCEPVDAANGVYDFHWPRALTAPGDYAGQFVVLDLSGLPGHSPIFAITLLRGA